MNATIKAEAGVMTLRAIVRSSVAHVVGVLVVNVQEFIATRGVFSLASALMVGHLRNGGTSLSSVTPDFT